MSAGAVRQKRSQKRALERDSVDGKRLRLGWRSESAVSVQSSSMRSGGEVKTLKLELQTADEPTDSSSAHTEVKCKRRSVSPSDVFDLSDDSLSPQLKSRSQRTELNTHLLMRSCAVEREHIIERLKQELRLEEAKLILLKKLRRRHTHTEPSAQKPLVSAAPLVKTFTAARPAPPVRSVAPPPLVRAVGKQGSAGAQVVMPALVRGAQSVCPQQQQQISRLQQISSSAPPALRSVVSSVQNQQRLLQPGLIHVTTLPNTGLLIINQTPAVHLNSSSYVVSESAAGVQASGQKQLEKCLLELPVPTAVPPALSFMPSAGSHEFLYLLGLEEAVQRLLEGAGPGCRAGVCVPLCCSLCHTDVSSRWIRDDAGVLRCERCVCRAQKRRLKEEHTHRLQVALAQLSSSSPAQVKCSPSSSSSSLLRLQQVSAQSSRLQSAVMAAALVNRPGVRMAYVNPSLPRPSSSSSSVQRHRELLLDMIPSRSAAHNTHNTHSTHNTHNTHSWK